MDNPFDIIWLDTCINNELEEALMHLNEAIPIPDSYPVELHQIALIFIESFPYK